MLKKKNQYSLAIVGATGAAGREMIEIIEERNFPVSDLVLFASERSEGERVDFRGKGVAVRKIAADSFEGVDIAFFSAGAEPSLQFAPSAVKSGSVVIDDSGAFAANAEVPLVVAEVNAHVIEKNSGIIASPGPATIALVMALKPIHAAAKIKRVVVTAFESVSGSGKKAMDELAQQTVALLNFREAEPKVYPHQIAFNSLPHVDSFLENAYTKEEMRIAYETRKILEDDSIRLTATAVRVPVFRSYSESVNIETEKKITANEARALFAEAPGLIVYDDPAKNVYPVALDAVGKDETYVGRIRADQSVPNGIELWIVSDNLRKGAGLNAVQIAEKLIG